MLSHNNLQDSLEYLSRHLQKYSREELSTALSEAQIRFPFNLNRNELINLIINRLLSLQSPASINQITFDLIQENYSLKSLTHHLKLIK